MRPVRVELEGFGAFRERTVVDFADADLFAIVGATGHGKSTLIDAICFALYGKVPRHGERDIAPAMTLGVNETKVSLTFELAGATFLATRVLRRKAGGEGVTTRALRLEALAPDGTTEIIAGKVGEFDEHVQRLVGLTFDQFTKCVVLPQGRFAAFLHASAGERVAILSALLDLGRYDRMAATARDRAREAAGRREVLGSERERLGEITAAAVDAAAARRDALAALQDDAQGAGPRDVALAGEIIAARGDAEQARSAAVALGAVHVPDDARDLARKAARALADAERAAGEADSAESRAAELEAIRAGLPSPETLATVRATYAERDAVAARIADGNAVRAERAAAAEAVRTALIEAQEHEAAVQGAADDAQRHHAHGELRATLRKGEPCPVCEQPVAALPPKLRTSELTKTRKALDAGRKQVRAASAAASAALDELHRADALLASLHERLGECEARLADAPDPADVQARAAEVAAAQQAAVAARRMVDDARARAQELGKAAAGAEKSVRRTEAEMQRQRDALVATGLEPPVGGADDVVATWTALAVWAAEVLPDHEKRAAQADDRARARVAERDAMLGDLAARAGTLGVAVTPGAPIAEMLPTLVGASRDAQHAVDAAAARLARAAELDVEIAASLADEQVAADLGRLLDKKHFGQWLVDEALHGLVDGASALLEQLSGGQYGLAARVDGELLVVDHANAGEQRSVRSLSGGETFQASLALALALADRIAALTPDGAATLESIFLDEGFGTLDPETLDVVAGTIESLGQGERVIGVVTHVAELAERMPVRFRVRREGRTAVVTREES